VNRSRTPVRWAAVHRAERRQLLETLRGCDPDQPTLCADWPASRLAAHLVVAEQYAGLPLGVGYPIRLLMPARVAVAGLDRMRPSFERSMDRAEQRGWAWLLDRLASGPPRLYRVPTLARIRLLEDWVHHEDLRRASGAPPRPPTPALDEALAQGLWALRRMAEFTGPRRHLGVDLPDGRHFELAPAPTVRISGAPGEVMLYLSGRASVARVAVAGDPEHLAALEFSLRI
jgi:uncharacterized protein (TIGR03085 family)